MNDERRDDPGSTEGPGNVSVDEPTDPALSEEDEDEFDREAKESDGGSEAGSEES